MCGFVVNISICYIPYTLPECFPSLTYTFERICPSVRINNELLENYSALLMHHKSKIKRQNVRFLNIFFSLSNKTSNNCVENYLEHSSLILD